MRGVIQANGALPCRCRQISSTTAFLSSDKRNITGVGDLSGDNQPIRRKIGAGKPDHVRIDAAGADHMHAHAVLIHFMASDLESPSRACLEAA